MAQKVSDYVLARLREWGVEHVFSYAGDGINAPRRGWRPPEVDRRAVAQTHCHQHAVLGFDADTSLMAQAGIDADVLDSGCCGLAGNFGFEKDHSKVSMDCAERVLLPAVRQADPDTLVLADGFSCRTQIAQGDAGGRRAVHLAEALHAGLAANGARDGTGQHDPE